MDVRADTKEFLTSRRARLTPEQVGLPDYGTRRVPGLRREEVAVLAGVSVPYYTRLERGEMSGVSDGVLQALARALQLDDAERAHLFDLARAAQPTLASPPKRRSTKHSVRPDLQWLLDTVSDAAAFVRTSRMDVLAANELGRALYSDMLTDGPQPANTARFVFLDPRAQNFYREWAQSASECVAALRSAAATPSTAASLTSSVSYPPAQTNSAPAGPPTTSASTTQPSSTCATPSSAISTSISTGSSSPETRVSRSPRTPLSRAPHQRKGCDYWAAGPQVRSSRGESATQTAADPKARRWRIATAVQAALRGQTPITVAHDARRLAIWRRL